MKRGDDFSAAEDAALESISDLAARSDLSHAMWLARGDIQIVNNHTILHSRNEYRDGDDPRKRRKLYRIWMQPHLARPLMADFANRYNTGPRGGDYLANRICVCTQFWSCTGDATNAA